MRELYARLIELQVGAASVGVVAALTARAQRKGRKDDAGGGGGGGGGGAPSSGTPSGPGTRGSTLRGKVRRTSPP